MNKLIILDFNRTLFDPDTNQLIEGALDILRIAKQADYKLVLLAMAAPSRRELIADLGIADYFEEIILIDAKSQKIFRELEKKYQTDLSRSYVLGDRALGELTHGHKAGWRTVWYRQGRFAEESPVGFTPDHTIMYLHDFLTLL